jgi:ATP-dependent Clp protease ATP-binding subunit ClpX
MSRENLPSPLEIIAELDRFIIGQERAKRDLATAVYNHYLSVRIRESNPERYLPGDPQHVILLGPTGSGKSFLLRTLSSILGVPFVAVPATSFVRTGYHGDDVKTMLQRLFVAAGRDLSRAQRGIIFIDEIDKIRRSNDGGLDVGGEGLQQTLLGLLDGDLVEFDCGSDVKAHLDVSRLLFVAAGSFVKLAPIVRKRLERDSPDGTWISSSGDWGDLGSFPDDEIAALAETEDLVEFGLIPELIARFSTVTALRALTLDEMTYALTEKEGSPLHEQRKFFAAHGIDLVFEDDALRAIATQSKSLGTGARGLHRAILRALDPVDYRISELVEQGATRVVFRAEHIEKGTDPHIEYAKDRLNPKRDEVDALRSGSLVAAALPKGVSSMTLTAPTRIRTLEEISALPEAELDAELKRLQLAFRLADAPSGFGGTWQAFESAMANRKAELVLVLEELAARGINATELHRTFEHVEEYPMRALIIYAMFWRDWKAAEEALKNR